MSLLIGVPDRLPFHLTQTSIALINLQTEALSVIAAHTNQGVTLTSPISP